MRSICAIAAATVLVSLSASANAATFGAPVIDPTFLASLDRVCGSQMVLSKTARTACTLQAFPAVTTDGKGFTNSGLGAEFNVLIRQLPVETATK